MNDEGESQSNSDTLSLRTKLLFSTGDLSSTLTLAIQTFFQMHFLTDVAKLEPSTVGWIIGITRLWDAVNDPVVGLISDRIKSKLGRRRVLLLYGSIPLGVAFALCWFVPPLGNLGLAIYFTLVIIAFDTSFTIVHVGFNSLTPVMTRDYDERSSLNGYRMVFSLGGTLAAIMLVTLLGETIENDATRFLVVGVVLGTLAMIPPWIVFSITGDYDGNDEPSQMPLWTAVQTTFSNRAFVMLAAMYLASWTATSVIAAMLVYYANYYLNIPEQAYYLILVAQTSAVASIPLCVWLAKTYDKPKAFVVCIAVWCLVLVVFVMLPRSAVTLAFVTALFCGPGIAAAAVIPWSMLPDVIEVEQVDSGERREGAYYALISFLQKLGIGVALWAIGQLLSWSGYITPTDDVPLPDQPEAVVSMIKFIIGPMTILLLLASLPFALRYPITRETHHETIKRIE
ncbi:MAG: MFS transporter [Planctomycetota bacterium]